MQSILAVLVIPTWVSLLMAVVILFLLLWLGYMRAPRIFGFGSHIVKTVESVEYTVDEEETGQPQKRIITTETQSARTVWEWLTVLTISTVIAVVALMFTARQAEQQREIQVQQANDDAMQAYFDEMSALLTEDQLRTSPEDSEVRTLARARTLTILSRLDPTRKSRLLEFLLDAELVQRTDTSSALISLRGANLSEVVLPADTDLSYADLSGADLSGADLSGANISNTDLTFAVLNDADLNDATVTGADLWRTDLNDAEGVTKDTLEKRAGYIGYTIMPNGKKRLPPTSVSASDIIKEYPKGRLPSGVYGESLRVGEYETDEFAAGFHFELGEGWKGSWPEATDTLTLCGEEACENQLNFVSPLYVFDASNPSAREMTPPPENAEEWMTWLQKHPNLDTSNSGSVNIGGAPGRRIEVTSSSTQDVPLYPITDTTYYAYPGWKDRFLIVDVAEETVIIAVSAPTDQFDEWLPKARKTLDTVEWQGV